MSYLKVIQKALIAANYGLPNSTAIQAEYDVASNSTKVTYPVNIRKLVAEIKAGKYLLDDSDEKEAAKKRLLRERLEKVVLHPKMLKKWSYIVDPVVPGTFDPHRIENCVRCGQEFSVGDTKEVECRYHALKPVFKYDYVESRKLKTYGCCSEPAEHSQGCTLAHHHVFKLNGAEDLASVIPFSPTPATNGPKWLFAAGVDCEMGFTSFGVELIRVTVVDWDTRDTVLDTLVHPYGKVIDLNSRFSGVHSLSDGIKDPKDGTIRPAVTFNEAREMLFQYVSANTILIGHGLENDLNALRIIHHRVVDTALMYPKFNPVFRLSLKTLAFRYLSRAIQDGEHDSSEDAIAAMDVVLKNIDTD